MEGAHENLPDVGASVGMSSPIATAGASARTALQTSIGPTGSAPIKRVSDIMDTANRPALVGRPVLMTRVRVEQVASDREFWVGRSPTDRVLVIVDTVSLNKALESRRGLEKGDMVNLEGTLERVPGTRGRVEVTSWGRLDQRDATALKAAQVYVYATRVQLSGRRNR